MMLYMIVENFGMFKKIFGQGFVTMAEIGVEA